MAKKFAYFGTPYVARDTLAYLLEHGYVPEVVITNPDAKVGRKHLLTPSPTKTLGLEKGIPVLSPQRLDDEFKSALAHFQCEYAVVVAYGKLFPSMLIDSFPLGVLNVHYSLLPKYRGASPVEAALRNGDTETGVTIQKMVPSLDAGDVVATAKTEISQSETMKELRPRLITLGAELLVSTLPDFENGTVSRVPQDNSLATHVGKIKKEDGLIDLSDNSAKNWNKYRAYAEWPGTYFFSERNGKKIRVKITKAELTSDGSLNILNVIPEGKKEMEYAVFLRSA